MSEKTLSEAQKRVQDLRKEFIKQTTNPHRHAAGEGGALVSENSILSDLFSLLCTCYVIWNFFLLTGCFFFMFTF